MDVRAQSWNHLQELLFHDCWNSELERYRSPFVYRGLSDSNYDLATSLMRLGGDFVSLERHLLRNFQKYAHRDFAERDNFWHWLTIAQHHGLPTRLLDWTYSPLVAMHFATANLELAGVDGAIWMVNYHRVSEMLPENLAGMLRHEGGNVFTEKMLSELAANYAEFDNLSADDLTLFFEPSSLDQRIVNQFALFSIISNPCRTLDDWLAEYPEIYFKIIVPAEIKWEVRDKLDQANITERVLFPGLVGLSNWLRRHYSPRRASSTHSLFQITHDVA